MAIAYQSYEITLQTILQNSWSNPDKIFYIQFLNGSYSYDKTHTSRADLVAYEVGTRVNLTGRATSATGGLSCDTVKAGQEISPVFAVIFFQTELDAGANDIPIIHLTLNGGDTLDINDSLSLNLGTILSLTAQNLGLCGVVTVDPTPGDLVCTQNVTTLAELNSALAAATGGEVICYTSASIVPFTLTSLSYTSEVTINFATGSTIIDTTVDTPVNTDSGTAGIYVNDCTNLRINGVEIVGVAASGDNVSNGIRTRDCDGIRITNCNIHDIKLYGIYARDSSNVIITDNTIDTIGQEAIKCTPDSDIPQSNWQILRNTINNTGVVIGQFGEGIYVGNGSNRLYGPVTGVIIQDNIISNTKNEAIDIKPGIVDAQVIDNVISNVDLEFNGAITIGTHSIAAPDGSYIVTGNTISNLTNRNGFDAFNIGVGQGNVTIENNTFVGDSGYADEFGIGLYKTAQNTNTNDAFIGQNSFGLIPSAKHYDLGVGVDIYPMDYFVLPSGITVWLDASDTSTITVAGTNVTEWRDKSGNGYNYSQATAANQPQSGTRTVNGLNTLDFNGTTHFLQNTNGPQFIGNSMMFVVVDADVVSSNQIIFGIQQGGGRKIFIETTGSKWGYNHSTVTDSAKTTATIGQRLVSGYRNGSTQFVEAEGATVTNTSGAEMNAASKWYVGVLDGTSRFFNGAICEIRVYNYYDATEYASIKAELELKWNV